MTGSQSLCSTLRLHTSSVDYNNLVCYQLKLICFGHHFKCKLNTVVLTFVIVYLNNSRSDFLKSNGYKTFSFYNMASDRSNDDKVLTNQRSSLSVISAS